MSACAHCRGDTGLYSNGLPVCADCAKDLKINSNTLYSPDPIRERLTADVLNTTAKKNEAFRRFEATMLHFPSGMPHPDGVQRIKNVSNNLTVARKEMQSAYTRLKDYLDAGIVPKDLKRRG